MLWLWATLVCLTLTLTSCSRCGARTSLVRKVQASRTKAIPQKVEFKDERECPQDEVEEEYVDAHESCCCIGSIVKKIDYGPSPHSEQHVLTSSSACLRCGLCLAVAEQLNDTLTQAQENITTRVCVDCMFVFDFGSDEGEETELKPEVVAEALQHSCRTGFVNYGLREYRGERYVTEAVPFTDHVATSLDGSWTENLRWLCLVYLNEYGEMNLYKAWMSGTRDLTDHLCRSRGIFRDCLNVDIDGYTATSKLFKSIRKPACL